MYVLVCFADATTSGGNGNSNQLLRELIDQCYTGKVLFPIVDPEAVAAAQDIGVGQSGDIKLGGTLDHRYSPLALQGTGACTINRPLITMHD